MTGLLNIGDIIAKRRHTLFGHVVRLDATTPAHQALEQVVATKAGRCPGKTSRASPEDIDTAGQRGREPQPVGVRCDRVRMNTGTMESRLNGPQLSMRHDDDDELKCCCGLYTFSLVYCSELNYKLENKKKTIKSEKSDKRSSDSISNPME